MLVVGAPIRRGLRVYNCAVVIQGGRVLGVAPKSYLPTYREFYEARWFAAGAGERGETIRVAGQDVPFGTDLIFRAADVPDLALFVEVCEDMWVPVPPSAQRRAGRRDRAGQHLRLPDHHRPGGGPARSWCARRARAAPRRTSMRRAARASPAPTSPGTGRRWSTSAASCSARGSAFPRARSARWSTSTSSASVRSGCGRAPSTTTGGPRRWSGTSRSGSRSTRRRATSGCAARSTGSRSCPTTSRRLALDCFEAYNIQVSGLEQRLKAIGQPKVVIGVSGGLDSTHALIVAAKAMDRLDRPRSDILAFTLPGFATGDTTKSYATRLSKALGVTFEEIDIRPAAEQMLSDMGHPFARGEEVYDVTFENVQAGLRTDYLFRIANQRGGIVLGTGDLSELALGWCTYGVGDQMSHYTVNSGVPEDPGPAPDPLGRRQRAARPKDDEIGSLLTEIVGQEITPGAGPDQRGRGGRSRPRARSAPTPCTTSRCSTCSGSGSGPSKIAFLAEHAWSDASRGEWPPNYPGGGPAGVLPRRRPRVARGLHQAVLRQPVQALRAAQRAQGQRRRHDVAARRLADAERRRPGGVAGRAGERAEAGTVSDPSPTSPGRPAPGRLPAGAGRGVAGRGGLPARRTSPLRRGPAAGRRGRSRRAPGARRIDGGQRRRGAPLAHADQAAGP